MIHLLIYAGNVNFVGENINTTNKTQNNLLVANTKVGLERSAEETMLKIVS
jgi:hypothetical protein